MGLYDGKYLGMHIASHKSELFEPPFVLLAPLNSSFAKSYSR